MDPYRLINTKHKFTLQNMNTLELFHGLREFTLLDLKTNDLMSEEVLPKEVNPYYWCLFCFFIIEFGDHAFPWACQSYFRMVLDSFLLTKIREGVIEVNWALMIFLYGWVWEAFGLGKTFVLMVMGCKWSSKKLKDWV